MSCDLLCVEKGEESMPLAPFDPAMISDPRVLQNLLRLELNSIPKFDYFRNGVQPELEPKMRKVLTTWMFEVCEEQHCEPQVFPLAVNLLDRYLACSKVHRCHLQLLACVCLLTSTKLRQCRALGVELLVYYTDYSVKAEEIRQWEKLLLTKLGWDIASVTAYDFVDPLLEIVPACRRARPVRRRRNQQKTSTELETTSVPEEPVSPLRGDNSLPQNEVIINKIRSHALTYVALSCTEYEFMQTTPSLLAAACVTLAITGLKLGRASHLIDVMVTGTRADRMRLCAVLHRLDAVMTEQLSELDGHAPHLHKSAPVNTGNAKHQAQVLDADGNPETPTDVQDVVF